MLDVLQREFPHFTEVLHAFQDSDRCRKLEIKSYLLKPIQRLPQYRLMLSSYLKHLTPDNIEFERIKLAEKIMSDVLDHLNQEVKKAEKAEEFFELQKRVMLTQNNNSLDKQGRDLIMHGSLMKVSRKELHERYFILVCLEVSKKSCCDNRFFLVSD